MGSTPGATATSLFGCGSSVLPNSSISAAPRSGNRGISQMVSRKFTLFLPLQQVDFIRLHGFLIAEQRDQDAQPYRRFGHRVGDHEDSEDLSVDILQRVRKGDQVDVHRVEDQLDRHQNDHDIAPRQHADGADEQQGRAQGQIMNRCNRVHGQILFFAITTEPTTATSSRTEAISNGSRYSPNNASAICSVLPNPGGVPAAIPTARGAANWKEPMPLWMKYTTWAPTAATATRATSHCLLNCRCW